MRLRLKKETLAALTDDELGGVAGGTIRTKYDCTESYQFCIGTIVVQSLAPTCLQTRLGACIPTQQGC
jgi:hypothetical protein